MLSVLWVTNTVFPHPARMLGLPTDFGGGWMLALADLLRQRGAVRLAVASVYEGKELRRLEESGITYYLLPGGARAMLEPDMGLEAWWTRVVDDFNPEVLHLHGSEYAHGVPLLRSCAEIPSVLSIQGLASFWAECYLDGIDHRARKLFRTFRDIVRRDGMEEQQRKFARRGIRERLLFTLTRNIIGRTTFDRAHARALNPAATYFHNDETLRPAFYSSRWRLSGAECHMIFISQSSAPYKGFHFMVRALPVILRSCPDARLVVAGDKCCDVSTWQRRIRETGYSRYLRTLIRERNVADRIHFTGPLTEEQMAAALCRSHVFVLPSSIENSPNSLGEAQIIGMPCVAACVGGVPDMVTQGESGLLYDHRDPEMLADRVLQVFESDAFAQRLGEKAREMALTRHDREQNRSELERIYEVIVHCGPGGRLV